MSDLEDVLGDFLDDLGDDVAPAQIEADAQNRAIILKRRKRALARHIRNNPELAFSFGKAFKSIGKGFTAPLRIVGKVATGDFKGALKTAVDPMGFSKLAKKGGKVAAKVQGTINRTVSLPKVAAKAQLSFPRISAGLKLPALPRTQPIVKMQCKPCDAAISGEIAKKVVPEMQRINVLLGKMELSRKATSEHNKKKRGKAWRKEVLRLLKQIQEKRCA